MKKVQILALVAACIVGIAALVLNTSKTGEETSVSKESVAIQAVTCQHMVCNIEACDYEVEEGVIPNNSFLSTILQGYGVAYKTVINLVEKSKGVFDVKKIRSKQPYYVLKNKENQEVDYFIYKQNTTDFVVFDMAKKGTTVYTYEKPVVINEKAGSGVIVSSLYEAVEEAGMTSSMAIELAGVFAWQIDFTRVQPGDEFKVLYEERICEGELIGTGNVQSAILTNSGKEFHAYLFNGGYYDENGKPLESMFLKSPVEFSRISSKFNKRRRHPIKKRIIPHLGTDYAAPKGTPIIAVADGVVTKSSYTGGNGKYVKLKHSSIYETQYLHMSKRGVKVGEHVKQGEVIGYVGSTGLATGPHVCFRFWKNGVQVNHLRQDLPAADPLDEATLSLFHVERKDLRIRLDKTIFSPEL
ncbi:MAG TPA: peptidase M23 [Flavobacteriales bacterium]|nr:peptidase M23 [Flavobacteriales bacterium]|tara:strand:+ start:8062 stop:9300 length:1239 start_codon:yes stop_codon:yes gene_type:complete